MSQHTWPAARSALWRSPVALLLPFAPFPSNSFCPENPVTAAAAVCAYQQLDWVVLEAAHAIAVAAATLKQHLEAAAEGEMAANAAEAAEEEMAADATEAAEEEMAADAAEAALEKMATDAAEASKEEMAAEAASEAAAEELKR